MNVLVTGGAGFIGSHLVTRLVQNGDTVRVFDNFSSGRYANVEGCVPDIEVIDGDLRDEHAVAKAVAGCEVVYHLGAVPSVSRSFDDPRTTMDVGVSGTMNVLQAARDFGSGRVILASSSAVYGDNPESPKREDMKPAPLSPYALSKLAGEQLCSIFSKSFGLETVALRYFNVYGPGQSPDSEYAAVIPKFIHQVISGVQPTIYGDGEQTRDFVYIDDVVNANILASTSVAAVGGVFNIGTQQAISLNTLLQHIGGILDKQVDALYAPGRIGDIRESLADASLARQTFGFLHHVSLAEGLSCIFEANLRRVGVLANLSAAY